MNEREIAYYNYVNRINRSMQTILDIYRLQQETISYNNGYPPSNNVNHDPYYNPHYGQGVYPHPGQPIVYPHYGQGVYPQSIYNNPYITAIPIINSSVATQQQQQQQQEQEEQESEFEREFREYIDGLISENLISETFSNIENPINTECPITQEQFNPDDRVGIMTHCRHIFKYDVINRWLRENYVCPMCRHDIRGENPRENPRENPQENSSGFQPMSIPEIAQRINNFLNNHDGTNRDRSLIIRYRIQNPNPDPDPDHPDNDDDSSDSI